MCQYSVEELTCTISSTQAASVATKKDIKLLSKSAPQGKVSDISIAFPTGKPPLKSKRENVIYHQSTRMTISTLACQIKAPVLLFGRFRTTTVNYHISA